MRQPRRAALNPLERILAKAAREVLEGEVRRIQRDPREWLASYVEAEAIPVADNARDDLAKRILRQALRIARVAAQQTRILLLASGLSAEDLVERLGIARGKVRAIDIAPDATMQALMTRWAAEGVERIVTLPRSATVGLDRAVAQWLRDGGRTEDLAPMLQHRLGIGVRHASLIARDQGNKLSSRVENHLLQSAGVNQYRWRTMRDQRVRDEHDHLEGQVFDMAGPGAPGADTGGGPAHPGEAINCRCYREPIV